LSAETYRAAERVRAKIMRALGYHCAICASKDNLTLDCIEPRGHSHHAAGFIGRQWFYWREYRLGNIQILCDPCQTRKGDMSQADFLAELNNTLVPEVIPISIKGDEQVEQPHNYFLGRNIARRSP
jgi:5-methylcytosine-specific restriction endonuclease McrA